MKILFLSQAAAPDYLCDTIFHGLRSLYGDEVVDCARLWYMYKADRESNVAAFEGLWGKAFTVYGNLPNDDKVDRWDIADKVASHYFDLIVFGCVYRDGPNFLRGWLADISKYYKPWEIAFLDGKDSAQPANNYVYTEDWLFNRGVYFKREITCDNNLLHPIGFSIPKEKVTIGDFKKTQAFASVIPGNPHKNTYTFDNEADYYNDMKRSFFGYTCKKGGWDAMRHYELIANGCIPFFLDIEKCPERTMIRFPKVLCSIAKMTNGVDPNIEGWNAIKSVYVGKENPEAYADRNDLFKAADLVRGPGTIDFDKFNHQHCSHIIYALQKHLLDYLTTERMAEYLVDRMEECKHSNSVIWSEAGW